MNIADLPAGSFTTFGDNELQLVSSKDDPPKFRMESPGPSRWLGALSFGRNGKELGLLGIKLSEDGKRGEFVVFLYDADRPGTEDDKMVQVLNVTTGTPPVVSHPTGTGQQLRSADGKYLAVDQGDGNFVVYLLGNMQPLWDKFSYEASHT